MLEDNIIDGNICIIIICMSTKREYTCRSADKRAYDESNQQRVCMTLGRIGPGRPTVYPKTCNIIYICII